MAGIQSLFIGFIDIILHLDTHLQSLIETYSIWVYVILFLIIFAETGLIILPFLPGDSLLFTAGAFAAIGSLDLALLFLVIAVAAVLGDFVNYTIGYHIGPKVFTKEKSLLFNKNYLVRAEDFYEKHGSKTIIIARFLPIIRTFAPFVAGIGKMKWMKFVFYNILGAILWCFIFILGGYFFGNIQMVRDHFTAVIMGIIVISFIPIAKEVIQSYLRRRKERKIRA